MAAELLTITEAARRFRLSPRTLRAAVRRGQLQASRPGRRVTYTTEHDVQVWLRRQAVPATPTAEARAAEIAKRLLH